MEEPKKEEIAKPIKIERKVIRCRYCGHRYAIRKASIFSIEDTIWYCEFCKRVVR